MVTENTRVSVSSTTTMAADRHPTASNNDRGTRSVPRDGSGIGVDYRRKGDVKIVAIVKPCAAVVAFLSLFGLSQAAADRVTIRVHAGDRRGPMTQMWAFYGYDEPNYTYTANGRKLLKELAQLSPVPVFVRAHNLLTTGDGTAALKWGSANAYTEDAGGRPVYDWTIVDRIL